jgi:hypothetical protein
MIFTKDSLQGSDYNWFPLSANILSDRFPTRKGFDRLSGDSMLRMINLFNLLISRLTLAEGRSMELALTKEFPLELRSEVSVFNWLKHRYLYDQEIK